MNVSLAVSCDGDLTTEHHDPSIEIVCVHFFREVGLLPAMDDFETLPAQVAFEGLTGERPAAAASARKQGNTFRTNMLGMHAARRHLETFPGTKRDSGVVAGDGDFATEDQCLGVEVMAVIGRRQVRLQAGVHEPIAVATQLRLEFDLVHSPGSLLGWLVCALWRTCCQL